MFVCNNHDIVNAHNYMTENGNVKFQQYFNEKNRKEWEVPEQRMEVVKWIHELKKGTYFPIYIYIFVVLITVFSTRFHRTNTDSTLSNGQNHVPQLNHHHILHHYYFCP